MRETGFMQCAPLLVARDRIQPISRCSSCVKISVFQCKMRLPGINFVVFKHSKSEVWESVDRGETQHKKGQTPKNFWVSVTKHRKAAAGLLPVTLARSLNRCSILGQNKLCQFKIKGRATFIEDLARLLQMNYGLFTIFIV